ncbi:MAG: hypothetical protein H0V92_11175 [Pseudonocardiales bacterium]|nr:hypothetical protein [Pseudonocardiales bacterium]
MRHSKTGKTPQDSTTGPGFLSRTTIALAIAIATLLIGATSAFAGVGFNVAPDVPTPVTVGDVVATSLTITNASNASQSADDVRLDSITLVPSCGTASVIGGDCPAGGFDPGVLRPSSTGTGGSGTSCAGVPFTIDLIDSAQGKYAFNHSTVVVLGAASRGGPLASCVIEFTTTVVKEATKDAFPATAGTQTLQTGAATGTDFGPTQANVGLTGAGFGTDVTTVNPSPTPPPPPPPITPPPPTTTPTPTPPVPCTPAPGPAPSGGELCSPGNTKGVCTPPPGPAPVGGELCAPQAARADCTTPPARAPKGGELCTRGKATITGRSGCQTKTFRIVVRGKQISKVIFTLDGKVVRTLRRPNSGRNYVLTVSPNRMRTGIHRVIAKVTFKRKSGTKAKKLRAVFQRCARKVTGPQFTG